MYKTPSEAAAFCERFKTLYKDTDIQAAILAPAVDLGSVARALDGTNIMYGAQNVYFEEEGAYTGEDFWQKRRSCTRETDYVRPICLLS